MSTFDDTLRNSNDMTMSPISHSASVALQQREIVRIHELWQKAKAELRMKTSELAELKTKTNILDNSSKRIQTQMEDTAQLQSQNLRMAEQIKVIEKDLEQARNENDKWQLHSEHLTLQLRESEGRLGEATARYRQQSLRIKQFEGRMNEVEEEKNEILSRSLADVRDHDEAVTLRNRKLLAQETRIGIQEELVGQLRVDLEDTKRKLMESEQRTLRSERKCRAFESDVEASRAHLRDHVQTKRTIEALKFEIDHLKRDASRMVLLLSSTEEYRYFQAQSQDSRGMTFIPKSNKKNRKTNVGGASKKKSSQGGSSKSSAGSGGSDVPHFDKSLLGQEYGAWGEVEVFSKVYSTGGAFSRVRDAPITREESSNWVPTDAVRLAFDFKQRHMQHVNMNMMNELLQQLNEIWRMRERRHVSRAKSRWVTQVKELKRQLQQRVPYAEVVQKNKINKLRRDLSNARGQVKIGMQLSMATTLGQGEEKQLLESTLMNVSELSEQLSILASENDSLVQKLRRAHSELDAFKKGTAAVGAVIPPSTAKQDRDFMEGAAWFGRNAVHTTDRLSASVSQIIQELRKQVIDNDLGDDILNQLDIVVKQCRDRMRRLFEGTLEDNVVPSNNNGRNNNMSITNSSRGASTLRVDNL